MNQAKRKRIQERIAEGYSPKEAYDLTAIEQIDDKRFNHAIWNENGDLRRKNAKK